MQNERRDHTAHFLFLIFLTWKGIKMENNTPQAIFYP